jgi:predicted mannosyl-3-phosphoglycerate phosphatase (HAD superfamily)
MYSILYFDSADQAKTYRELNGVGGWIFVCENGTAALYPWTWTPSEVFADTDGNSGTLI